LSSGTLSIKESARIDGFTRIGGAISKERNTKKSTGHLPNPQIRE
jgi:hypothetical protein